MPQKKQLQVFTNVQLLSYDVRTFTLCCQTFILWVHPHTICGFTHKIKLVDFIYQQLADLDTS